MAIFKISGTKLKKLNSLPLDKEKNLQALVEVNHSEVLDLLFLATEYTTTFGDRIRYVFNSCSRTFYGG